MQIKIDYYVFTVKREPREDEVEQEVLDQVLNILEAKYPCFVEAIGGLEGWAWQPGKKPYRASIRRADSGISIWVHPALDHAMIEFTGSGCDTLGEWHDIAGFIAATCERATRLDLACDMLTDTSPLDFVSKRKEGRFKATGHADEQSGSTQYVGSWKSDRFACVYRYNEPHPRSHLLRCEYRLRGENAKITARSILQNGKESVAKALGDAFGWEHPEWRVESPSEIELRAYRPDRKVGGTLFWLNDTVAPLLLRLYHEGKLDVFEWFESEVSAKLMQMSNQ